MPASVIPYPWENGTGKVSRQRRRCGGRIGDAPYTSAFMWL